MKRLIAFCLVGMLICGAAISEGLRTNGGVAIAPEQLPYWTEEETAPQVYFISDITPACLMRWIREHQVDAITTRDTTAAGYINANNQRNNGKTEKPGTDNNQFLYEMECLNCGMKYYANGSDIWQRKCPSCQGGRQ